MSRARKPAVSSKMGSVMILPSTRSSAIWNLVSFVITIPFSLRGQYTLTSTWNHQFLVEEVLIKAAAKILRYPPDIPLGISQTTGGARGRRHIENDAFAGIDAGLAQHEFPRFFVNDLGSDSAEALGVFDVRQRQRGDD